MIHGAVSKTAGRKNVTFVHQPPFAQHPVTGNTAPRESPMAPSKDGNKLLQENCLCSLISLVGNDGITSPPPSPKVTNGGWGVRWELPRLPRIEICAGPMQAVREGGPPPNGNHPGKGNRPGRPALSQNGTKMRRQGRFQRGSPLPTVTIAAWGIAPDASLFPKMEPGQVGWARFQKGAPLPTVTRSTVPLNSRP